MSRSYELDEIKATLASETVAAGLLVNYQKRLLSNPDHFRSLSLGIGGDAEFERAIFEKGSSYLRLMLAEAVTSPDVARDIWIWIEQSNELSVEQRLKVKQMMLEGSSASEILLEGRYGNLNEKGLIGIVSSLSEGETWPLFAVFRNPFLKNLIANVLLKKEAFESIDDSLYPELLQVLAFNPLLNQDEGNEHGPDLAFWDLEKGIEKWLACAPATQEWFDAFTWLFDEMHPDALRLRNFSIVDFIEKWKDFEPRSNYRDDTVGGLIDLVAVKFGSSLIEGQKLTLKKALAMDNSPVKAAYFGTTNFKEKDLMEIVVSGNSFALWCLCFNVNALLIPKSRRELEEIFGEDHFFKKGLAFLKKKYPKYFVGDISDEGGDSKFVSFSRTVDNRLLKLEEKLQENTRMLFYILGAVIFSYYLLKH